MRDAFRECPVNMHQKSQNNRRIPLSKNLATKGNAQHCVAYRNRIEENHKVHYQEILHNVGFAKAFYYYLGMSCRFLGSMRCKSGSANKFKHHVSCVLPPSHLRITLQFIAPRTHQNLQPATKNRSLRNILFQWSWRCPAPLKNQNGQLPGPSNLPRSWKQTQKHIKTECLLSFFGGK